MEKSLIDRFVLPEDLLVDAVLLVQFLDKGFLADFGQDRVLLESSLFFHDIQVSQFADDLGHLFGGEQAFRFFDVPVLASHGCRREQQQEKYACKVTVKF